MDDKRQVMRHCILGLHFKRPHLLVAEGLVPIQVHPYLADGDVFGTETADDTGQIVAPRRADFGRMQAHR